MNNMAVKRQFHVDILYQALADGRFQDAQSVLPGAKNELDMLEHLAEDEKCKNAINRLKKIVGLVEAGHYGEAQKEEVTSVGAFKRNLKGRLCEIIDSRDRNKNKEQMAKVSAKKNVADIANPAEATTQTTKQATASLSDNKQISGNSLRKTHNGHLQGIGNNSQQNSSSARVEVDLQSANDKDRMQQAMKTPHSDTMLHGKVSSRQFTLNNPEIADLSDANRPTRLAERFSELYDNEWTEAFEYLNKKSVSETNTIEFLLKIVRESYEFCTKDAERKVERLSSAFFSIMKQGKKEENCPSSELKRNSLLYQILKEHGDDELPGIKKNFLEHMKKQADQPKLPANKQKVHAYCEKSVELAWWMCVQYPPVYMCPTDDTASADKNLYRAYTKSGEAVAYFVWPALKLYKDGGVLMKGVAQYM